MRELTLSELIQNHLKSAHLVKMLYNLDMLHLKKGARPHDKENRWVLPITGDNTEAKVEEFMDQIGYDAVVCGTLADSWKVEADTLIYVNAYVNEISKGMTEEEGMKGYAEDNAAGVTKEKVLELAEKATITGSVGGNPDSLPKQWTDWLKHL